MKKFTLVAAVAIASFTAACGGSDDSNVIKVPKPLHHGIVVTIPTKDGTRYQFLCETRMHEDLRPIIMPTGKHPLPYSDKSINGMQSTISTDHYLSDERCPSIPVGEVPSFVEPKEAN